MTTEKEIEQFLSPYDEQVFSQALKIRAILLASFPAIIEQIDVPAKMIAYCYGQKYVELLCVLIPSKKGLKLGFNRGVELPDPEKLLKGTGKISRYIEIKTEQQINSTSLKQLLVEALKTYEQRIKK
jgi:hypothetical protein